MSGHNKWSKIKRKKGVTDARRSKMFTRVLKDISVAVRESGPDPDSNPRLRLALANGKGINLPKDNIERAIARASEVGGSGYHEVAHEGYGPGGIAIYIECTTDNLNRTLANVRLIMSKRGGTLGNHGSLSFLFDRKGVFIVPQGNLKEDDFMMSIIDAGAEEVELDEGVFTITTMFEDFGPMQKRLEELGIEAESSELQQVPKTATEVDVDTARKVMNLIEVLEEDDDVHSVFHNMELTEELAAQLD